MLVVVRDVEKESEIESEGSLKKAFFFQKTRFAVAKMAKNACFACFACVARVARVACVQCDFQRIKATICCDFCGFCVFSDVFSCFAIMFNCRVTRRSGEILGSHR